MKVEQQKDSKQKKIVQIEDLSVSFDGMEVVKHVNIEVNSGEIVGIVGESGSGKSITSLTLMGLLSKQTPNFTPLPPQSAATNKAGTGDIRENNRGWGSIKRSRQTF